MWTSLDVAEQKLGSPLSVAQRTMLIELDRRAGRVDGLTVVGVDEVGWGALAGPLTVCAFAAPARWDPVYLKESKSLTRRRREEVNRLLGQEMTTQAVIQSLSAAELDCLGASQALRSLEQQVMTRMFDEYGPDVVFVFDGTAHSPGARLDYCTGSIPKADVLVPVVAAASVCAKVQRDAVMHLLAKHYPVYMFERNAGYGTAGHRKALAAHGLCAEHRRSYEPMRSMVEKG